jgi:pimeloyl-ACP methyl ester carboxylesterase
VPTYLGSALDSRAALSLVRDTLGVAQRDIVYFGHSLGTAIAAELAGAVPPRVLILQAPFSSARAMSRRMFLPGLVVFWELVSRVHFNTLQRVGVLEAPVWVTHGDKDFVIPVRMGREVFAAAKHKGELLIVHGAGHNDVADVGAQAYWEWLSRAVRSGVTPAAPTGMRQAP